MPRIVVVFILTVNIKTAIVETPFLCFCQFITVDM